VKIILMVLFLFCMIMAKHLYVATDGDNAVTYANNDINHPWLTIEHGIYQCNLGDTLFIRGGVYTQLYPIITRGDYWVGTHNGNTDEIPISCESGTVTNPVLIRNYASENVIIDCANVNIFCELDNISWWKFRDLNFINANYVFYIGENTANAHHNEFSHMTIRRNRGGDNAGGVTIVNGNAEYTVIDSCEFVGPEMTASLFSANTCGIYFKAVQKLKIRHCRIDSVSIGIYSKHLNITVDTTDIEVAGCYITNTGRNALNWNARRAWVHDNLMVNTGGGIANANSNGGAGGDYNKFEHNTLYDGVFALKGETTAPETDSGSKHDTLLNNILMDELTIHEFAPTVIHYTVMDYNAFGGAGEIITEYNTSLTYDLSSWQIHYGQSVHSQQGTVVFASETPSLVTDFALDPLSIGYQACADGSDMGARIDSVFQGFSSGEQTFTPTDSTDHCLVGLRYRTEHTLNIPVKSKYAGLVKAFLFKEELLDSTDVMSEDDEFILTLQDAKSGRYSVITVTK